ncbi:glycosyltransferase family 4 protein [Candidatus Poribacteria bacterium]
MYITLPLCSCLVVLILTPLLRRAAVRNGFLDHPGERKVHRYAVPRIGGLAIGISFYASMVLSYALFHDKLPELPTRLTGFFIGAAIIIIIGIWDDLWGLNAQTKIAGQIAAVLVLMPFGFVVRKLNIPYVGVVELGWRLGVPFTVFWVVGIVNAINLIDGVDGLAAGVAMVISFALFIVSLVTGQVLMGIICLAIAGSVLGFLTHNFHPATIFMGDCGAMFLGFILAAVSVRVLFQNTSVAASSFASVLIFGLPIVDTTWAIIRRLVGRKSPFRADGLHIHHRLVRLGLTQRQTVVVLYIVSSLSAAAGLIIVLTGSERWAVVISAVMTTVALTGIVVLRHVLPALRLRQNSEKANTDASKLVATSSVSTKHINSSNC